MPSLREKQSKFVKLLGRLIEFAYCHGWELTLADGSIDKFRTYIDSKGDRIRGVRDAVHMIDGLHYVRLAQDLNLFVNGVWKDRDCPEWQLMGKFWKMLDPEAAWGGDFGSVDLNHFSIKHAGKQ